MLAFLYVYLDGTLFFFYPYSDLCKIQYPVKINISPKIMENNFHRTNCFPFSSHSFFFHEQIREHETYLHSVSFFLTLSTCACCLCVCVGSFIHFDCSVYRYLRHLKFFTRKLTPCTPCSLWITVNSFRIQNGTN